VKDAKAARQFERIQLEDERKKAEIAAHRVAPYKDGQHRMSSWAAGKSPAQQNFENRKTKGARSKGPSTSERMEKERFNYNHEKGLEKFERHKELDMKVRKEQRGIAGQVDHTPGHKRVQEKDWEDAIRQSRTEFRKNAMIQSAVVPVQRRDDVEDDTTHRSYGHLTKAELADYGMVEGETLDEEGRVIPPWVGRAERYAGPEGENEVRYPFDYGYGARGQFEASRGKMPPPQLFLKDKSAKPRRDPDLHDPMFPYVPYGSDPAMAIHPGFARPEEVSALAYERAGYGFGYGRPAMPMYSHPAYGPCVPY
jgi:hypothetical protein